MIQDLHSHTYYSFCGKDKPEEVIRTAIEGGIELLGITDHNYGVAFHRDGTFFRDEQARIVDYQRALRSYCDYIRLLADKYKDQIRVLAGIEVATQNYPYLLLPSEVSLAGFDYCLIEHISDGNTIVSDLFAYAKSLDCPRCGIAHTDLPAYARKMGYDLPEFFSRMAEQGIFWELNVNYDSIHNYREHAYVKEFLEDEALQDIVRKSGVQLSVGFDGHRLEDYLPERVADCCRRLEELEIPMVRL